MPNKINYIKPTVIHVNKPNTVRKPQVNSKPANKPAVQHQMTIEQRNERLKRIREYQQSLKDKQLLANNLKQKNNKITDIRALSENQVIDHGTVFTYGNIEPIWRDQTVYIIGGGPSLTGFDFNKLQGKNVIAVNKAYAYVKMPFVLYWTDARFYKWYQKEIDELKCMKVTSSRNLKDMTSDVIVLKSKTGKELDINSKPFEIHAGNNSGYGAIHLAIKMGAKKIYLLGYDMQHESNKSHWHGGYPTPANHRESIYKSMLQYFERSANIIKGVVEIYNVNPNSALKCFSFCTMDEALASS